MSDLEIDTELALTNLQELEHKYFRSAEGGLANLSIRVIKALQEQLATLQAEKERLEEELGRLEKLRTMTFAWLSRHGQHASYCEDAPRHPCSCGYSELHDALNTGHPTQEPTNGS